MNKFQKLLQEGLEQMPSTGIVSDVLNAATKVQEAEAMLGNFQEELHGAIESLNARLALEVRKRMAKLQVNLADGKCRIKYKTKAITVFPNLKTSKWEIELNDMGRGFMKGFGHALPMDEDLSAIAEAISEYSTGHYKTLGDTYSRPQRVPVRATEQQAIRQRGKSKPGNSYYA